MTGSSTLCPRAAGRLLIEGEAGIGKTALWQAGVEDARRRGIRVLSARSAPAETRIAFATIGDLFGPALEETLPLLPPVQRRSLEIALLLREAEGPPPDVRVLALSLVSVLRVLAEREPVLVALDDVQWVDASSAEILGFTLRRVADQPIGVLATVRGRPVAAPLGLDDAFAECERLLLDALSIGAIHRILWGRLSLNLPRPTLVRLHETAGGNPFYALELGRALVDGTIRQASGPMSLPESLQAVVAERLDALSARVRETLVAVAALAVPTVRLLEPLAVTTIDDIEHAQARGVLELDGDRIRFTHPLLAPACYSTMPLHRRRRLHRRLADLDVDLEERARHLAIAATGPDEEIAAALDAAAAHARARGAAQAAAELAELAVALTPVGCDRRRQPAPHRRRRELHVCGRHLEGPGAARGAVGSSRPGPIRAEALSQLAGVHAETEGFHVAEELLNRALAEPGLEAGDRIDILCRLAWMAAAGGGSAGAASGTPKQRSSSPSSSAEPRQLAATPGDLRRAHVLAHRTHPARPARACGRTSAEPPDGDDGARVALALLLGRADQHEEARAIWLELIAEANGASRSRRDLVPDVPRPDGSRSRRVGRRRAALRRRRSSSHGRTGREMGESLCLMVLAEIDAYRGEREGAERDPGPAASRRRRRVRRGDVPTDPRPRVARALVRRRRCELAAGRAALRGYRRAGRGARATRRLGRRRGAHRHRRPRASRAAAGAARRARRGLGHRPPTARRRVAGACCSLRRASTSGRSTRCESAAVEARRRLRERTRSSSPERCSRSAPCSAGRNTSAPPARPSNCAAASFERLGARALDAQKTRSELRRIGGRTASSNELSETERRIVELVVAGRRNREVAAELSLSPNTVAWNLSKIYRKLGVSSRTELAARIAATPSWSKSTSSRG